MSFGKVCIWSIDFVGFIHKWICSSLCIAQKLFLNWSKLNPNGQFFMIQDHPDRMLITTSVQSLLIQGQWTTKIDFLKISTSKQQGWKMHFHCSTAFSYALMFPILAWIIVTDSLPLWFESACSKIELRAGEKQRELLACWTKFRICKRLSSVSRVL